MTPSSLALVIFSAWTLLLLVAIAALHVKETLAGRRPHNGFAVFGGDISEFSARLCRAHANCYENLPAFGALLLVAVITGHSQVTDPLALWLVAARIGQSVTHLISTRNWALNLRFVFFIPQMAVPIWWVISLMRLA